MSGLLRRLTRRRPATADEPGAVTPGANEPAAAPAEAPVHDGAGSPTPPVSGAEWATGTLGRVEPPAEAAPGEPSPVAGAGAAGALGRPVAAGADQPTQVIGPTVDVAAVQPQQLAAAHTLAPAPPPAPGRDLPAGVDPAELQVAPAPSARRGRLRRRLRYLRRVRELLLRDLGGFFYEVHRTAGGDLGARQRELAEAKSARLTALDAEVRALEARLGEPHAEPVLSEPGIGGACGECGELFSSDAHYCFRCGNPLDDRARAAQQATIAAAAAPVAQETDPGQASVLWAGGPRSEAASAPPRGEGPASPATSEWLLAKEQAPAGGALFAPAPVEPEVAAPSEPEPEPVADAPEPEPEPATAAAPTRRAGGRRARAGRRRAAPTPTSPSRSPTRPNLSPSPSRSPDRARARGAAERGSGHTRARQRRRAERARAVA